MFVEVDIVAMMSPNTIVVSMSRDTNITPEIIMNTNTGTIFVDLCIVVMVSPNIIFESMSRDTDITPEIITSSSKGTIALRLILY